MFLWLVTWTFYSGIDSVGPPVPSPSVPVTSQSSGWNGRDKWVTSADRIILQGRKRDFYPPINVTWQILYSNLIWGRSDFTFECNLTAEPVRIDASEDTDAVWMLNSLTLELMNETVMSLTPPVSINTVLSFPAALFWGRMICALTLEFNGLI